MARAGRPSSKTDLTQEIADGIEEATRICVRAPSLDRRFKLFGLWGRLKSAKLPSNARPASLPEERTNRLD
jgi:hypothetical protein